MSDQEEAVGHLADAIVLAAEAEHNLHSAASHLLIAGGTTVQGIGSHLTGSALDTVGATGPGAAAHSLGDSFYMLAHQQLDAAAQAAHAASEALLGSGAPPSPPPSQ